MHISSVLSLLFSSVEACTYRSLGVQGDGNLTTRLSLLGGAGVVNNRLVVRILALQAFVSFRLKSAERTLGSYMGEVPAKRNVR